MLASLRQQYWRQGLWSLLLMCAFPVHAWTLILAFRDISWLTERTNAWDAIGVVSYGLLFTFFESWIVFFGMALLGFLVSTKWARERRLALLSVLVLILALWAMAVQLFFLLKLALPGSWVNFLIQSGHPLWVMSAVTLFTVGLSFLIPALLVVKSTPAFRFVQGLIERLSLLAMFYLCLDAVGLVIVLIRNM